MSFWWQPLPLAGSLLLDGAGIDGSGTTLAALQAGSASFKYTAVIEGYEYILTDGTTQQATDAWAAESADHGYESALPGLFVSMENQQQLDWRKPFPRGGHLTLHISPDADDTFGIDTHKRNAGQQTELTSTLDRDDTTVNVKSTSGWDPTGTIYIGGEAITYTGTTTTSFTGCTRGKYAPMVNGNTGTGWSEYHRVGTNDLEVLLNPLVTSLPRVWVGKWVAVYLHKFDASIPALNSKANALRVFAGRIVSITDDPKTGATVVEVKHALDCVAEHSVGGRDQWRGKIRNTIRLEEGWRFSFFDWQKSALTDVPGEADDLVVVSGAASNTNEVSEGDYEPVQLYEVFNAWWAGEKGAGRISGTYKMGHWLPKEDNSIRAFISWEHNVASSTDVSFKFELPRAVANFLGYYLSSVNILPVNGTAMYAIASATEPGDERNSTIGDYPLTRFIVSGSTLNSAKIIEEEGTFKEQTDFLPSGLTIPQLSAQSWGIFLVDNRLLVYGYYSGGDLFSVQVLPEQFGLEGAFGNDWRQLPLTQDGPQDTDIRQIFILEMPFGSALKRILLSTDGSGYNHPTWDALAHGLGIGIPGDLVDATFIASIDALPHADKPIALIIDRSTRLEKLLAGELILRRAFLRWKNGRLEFATWRSLVSGNSAGTLSEANKAAPAGNIDHHRSVTQENGGWAVPIVTIQYNRTLKASPDGSEGYKDSIQIVDKAAVDDLGGEGPSIVINARGTLGDFHQTGGAIGTLANGFMASMPYFSRPARQTSRSIDQRYFEGYSIGDVVGVSDEYARDPDTGQRGIVTRYGIITRHRYSLGGLRPGSDQPDPQGGEVDLFFLDINRVAEYVPSAQVDETQTNGGYAAASSELTVYAHAYSESTEAVDASRFVASDKIRIIQIDPDDPAAPLSWDRTVSSVLGNVITFSGGTLTGWDANLRYRIVFDTFGDAVATQQAKAYQADDADLLIADARAPYEYGIGGQSSTYTAWSASDMVELPPNGSYGDGVGRDTGHEFGLIRLLNNLTQYKQTISSPMLASSALNSGAWGGGTATRYLVQCSPVFLSGEILSAGSSRLLSVAPHFRSKDGSGATVRVTLSSTPPTGSTWYDVGRGFVYDEVEFSTTSTTYATPTADTLEMTNVKGMSNVAWLYVEVTEQAETYGLGLVQEGPVQVV